MVYDLSGSWSNETGPNSAMYDACAPGPVQAASALSAVNSWMAAGFKASQVR